MKRRLQIIIHASSASLLVFGALAQNPAVPRPASPDYARDRVSSGQTSHRLSGAVKSTDLIGMDVKNLQDEKLGKVEELAVDMESGRVIQVILATGGFIGIGETHTAVPPGALHYDAAQKVVHLDATKEKLKNAPEFDKSKWAEHSDAAHVSAVYRQYGQEQAYSFVQTERGTDSQRTGTASQRTGSMATGTNDSQRTATRQADGTWAASRSTGESMIPAARLGQAEKASKLTGKAVKNVQDEKIGDIKDLVVDLRSGRVLAVIVETGNYLGVSDELSAVPPSAFRFSPDRDTIQLDVSKDALSRAPHFKANQWPDFNQPSYAGGIYRAYNIEPYFSTDATDLDDTRRAVRDRDTRSSGTNAAPDNSGRNVRDRDNQTATPFDQGNSQIDVAMTAQIRNEIIAARGMSVNARNVKIITNEGRVILRGPVNSEEEKRQIGEIAARIAPAGRVENQLEVKPAN